MLEPNIVIRRKFHQQYFSDNLWCSLADQGKSQNHLSNHLYRIIYRIIFWIISYHLPCLPFHIFPPAGLPDRLQHSHLGAAAFLQGLRSAAGAAAGAGTAPGPRGRGALRLSRDLGAAGAARRGQLLAPGAPSRGKGEILCHHHSGRWRCGDLVKISMVFDCWHNWHNWNSIHSFFLLIICYIYI